MKKLLLTLTAAIAFGFITKAQNVVFNDANLKQKIAVHGKNVVGGVTGPNISIIDTDDNYEISLAEAQAYTGRLFLNQNGSDFYTDLTGVEEFIAITELFCENNQMTSLSVAAHPNLVSLYCENNQISSLDLSNNTNLVNFNCRFNNLTTLNLNSNTSIEDVVANNNSITSMDVSAVSSLEQLDISDNPLSTLVLPTATNLFYLNVFGTNLTGLDVSTQIGLNFLYAGSCANLASLNVANGANTSLDDMYATNNPSLSCIKVDDPVASAGYSDWLKDASTTYSIDCAPPTRFYVDEDATGNNNGTSWADAYTDLRDAFTNSSDGMEIWVAEGTYRRTGTNRDVVFGWTTDSLKVYGGFNGTETALSQRDWRANETIMSGNMGALNSVADNAYSVLVGPIGSSSNILNYSLIDGFTVQDGNANGSGALSRSNGAGFFSGEYVRNTDIKNCTFSFNLSSNGGGAAVFASQIDKTVNFESCTFVDNLAPLAAAIHARGFSGFDITMNISNCLFEGNGANSVASGNNQSTLFYFGVNSTSALDIDITNSTMANNQNFYAGTNQVALMLLFCELGSNSTRSLTLRNNIIWDNDGNTQLYREHSGSGAFFTDIDHQNSISDLTGPSFGGIVTTTDVINQDPLFRDVSNRDVTLLAGSPAIDAGSQTGLTIPSFDLAGNTRVEGSEIDMGCYEFSCPQFIFQITESNGVLSAPTSFATYQWSFDGNDITGATSATYTPTQTGVYTLEVSDGSCPKVRTIFFCSTDLLTLFENNGVLTAPSGFNTYEWFLDGVLITGASNAVYATTQDGEYYCEATFNVPNGLGTCTQTTATISICSAVTVDITESNGTLTATPGYTDYQWFKDGVAITGATNDTYEVTEDGNYTCDATENGCTASSNTITITGTSIRNVAFERVNVYPNPTNGIINLDVSEELSSIRIMDLTGKTLRIFDANATQLNIAEFNTGIYFLEIANAEKKSVMKIIKK